MIIARLYGGLGNQMFQYAVARALAIKNKTNIGLDLSDLLDRTPRKNFTSRNYSLDVFNIEAKVLDKSEIPFKHRSWGKNFFLNKLKRYIFGGRGRERGFTFKSKILELPDDTYLDGYFQSQKYFESIKDIIKKDFTLKNPLPENIKNLQKEISNKNSVCLHVRRGDYVDNKFHNVLPKDYYEKALEIISQKINIEQIYVFSDDISWCEENLSFGYKVMFVGEDYAGEKATGHFELMKSCRYFIIANSSFSWWTAWLAESSDKIVVAPKNWFNNTSVDINHRIPENWIKI